MTEQMEDTYCKGIGRKIAIGYQLSGETIHERFHTCVAPYTDKIKEVYFAIPGDASGRVPVGDYLDVGESQVNKIFISDLQELKKLGLTGTLLFNSSCYGALAVSAQMADHVKKTIDTVSRYIDIKAVTTLSPFVASVVKRGFPEIGVRSSVTMQVGEIYQMELLGDLFDGYYLFRDRNRDFEHVKKVRAWCTAHGKTLHILANSGCMYRCPYHDAHMAQMAHARGIFQTPSNWKNKVAPCTAWYQQKEYQHGLLQNTWIRPEDMKYVAEYFDTIKLASRSSHLIKSIIKGYCDEEWHGNFLELLEPCLADVEGFAVFNNDKFPDSWFKQTMSCGHHCDSCGYCKSVYEKIAEYGKKEVKA